MDFHGNINLLCSLETSDTTYKRDTIFLSTAALKKCMANIKNLGNEKMPFKIEHTEQGKSIIF